MPWRQWGPYLSERQWGTVREDYSENGDAWDYFTHDQARSRAYHWGEDGLAGLSDDKQRLCFSLALWNGKDPILKERIYGLTNSEANHGEDVKEYYFYLDSTPTHSYMKYLYKYPQEEYPYLDLIRYEQTVAVATDPEYELLDTGIFNENRYFDVFVEYAKAAPTDILIQISICNRGPAETVVHVLPTLWFRNIWTWWPDEPKPSLKDASGRTAPRALPRRTRSSATISCYCEGNAAPAVHRKRDQQRAALRHAQPDALMSRTGSTTMSWRARQDAVNPNHTGTKAAAHYQLRVGAGATAVIRLRLSNVAPGAEEPFGTAVRADHRGAPARGRRVLSGDNACRCRRRCGQCDAAGAGRDAVEQTVLLSSMSTSGSQEHGVDPLRPSSRQMRNREWFHMISDHVISMPDKWEYPWFAAWDLAFHTICALPTVDIDFAKQQLDLLLSGLYLHPTGQIPAYEWNFSDVNPPVHGWATIFLYRIEQALRGKTDLEFLKRVFGKLTSNFGWWVNRKDRFGRNLFEGGFLGLDNIGVFDRSAPLPTGGYLEQADGTAWVALFSPEHARDRLRAGGARSDL